MGKMMDFKYKRPKYKTSKRLKVCIKYILPTIF